MNRKPAQPSLYATLQRQGVVIPQAIANELGFKSDKFRELAVQWLIDNNHPLREFESPTFRVMIAAANPLAKEALWHNHQSVTRYIIHQYHTFLPFVPRHLSESDSKLHFSFDGWTTRGMKKCFTGMFVHHYTKEYSLEDYPIALPILSGSHTGERIGEVVYKVLEAFGIPYERIGYFVLNNASNNDTAVEALASIYGFNPAERRCRCSPHIVNLVAQTMMFGRDKESFENNEAIQDEDTFIREWRKEGPLGTLCEILNSIRTPQQQEKLYDFHQRAHEQLGTKPRPISLIKPIRTGWNSFLIAFRRAVELKDAIDAYVQYYIEDYRARAASQKTSRKRKKRTGQQAGDAVPAAPEDSTDSTPRWVLNGGMTSDDWHVVNQYIRYLQPLEHATQRLQGRGKSGRFGAAWEVLPIFDTILVWYETEKVALAEVDYNAEDAMEDHYKININLAWNKMEKYWAKLDDCPAYYAACRLHPSYKNYTKKAWADKPEWIGTMEAKFLDLWASYRDVSTTTTSPPRKKVRTAGWNQIDDMIDAQIETNDSSDDELNDDYARWLQVKAYPKDHEYARDPFLFWKVHRKEFPQLYQLAIDVLSIPASSADCERMFSELGDMLEPRRQRMSPQLIAALQCTRHWMKKSWIRTKQTTATPSDREVDELTKLVEEEEE